MACKNCSKSMVLVTSGLWWCPICGTIKGGSGQTSTPALVTRVRDYAFITTTSGASDSEDYRVGLWHGILEAAFPADSDGRNIPAGGGPNLEQLFAFASTGAGDGN